MIDLHSHILFGLDDGADTLDTAVAMARIAVADGTTDMACTPHVMPGRYANSSATIMPAVGHLQSVLTGRGIPLKLVAGADVHLAWDLPEKLTRREIPTLNDSRYFLLEPPHQFLPPMLEELARRLLDADFIPVITHPERLVWVKNHYDVVRRLEALGCPLQLTADSILGRFGAAAQGAAARMLDDGLFCFFASDAHGTGRRNPAMSQARAAVAARWGADAAERMFETIPATILADGDLPRSRAKQSAHARTEGYAARLRRMLGLLRAGETK